MRVLTAPLEELGEFEEIKRKLQGDTVCAALTGCVESQKLHMVCGLGGDFKNRLIVTFSDLRVKELMEDYRFYDRNVTAYPAKDLIFYQADVHGNQLVTERIKCLKRMLEGRPVTVVTTFSSLMAP
ncbi:MAG: transcription-repair coupling factor, partial [Clostridium sp.]|nr:transcription-repair coupling factor [Clostridium sp.]